MAAPGVSALERSARRWRWLAEGLAAAAYMLLVAAVCGLAVAAVAAARAVGRALPR